MRVPSHPARMSAAKLLSLAFALTLLPVGSRAAAPVVESWIAGSSIAPSDMAALAVPIDGSEPLVAHNERDVMNPASVMKLVTSWVALSRLGPGYRWRTPIFLQGSLTDGLLQGDLAIRGALDPRFVVEDLQDLVARLRQAGLRDIRGDVVIDTRVFDAGGSESEQGFGDSSQPFNVRPHAWLVNFKSVRVTASLVGGRAVVDVDPELAGIGIDNLVSVGSGPCNRAALSVSEPAGGQGRLRVRGTVIAGCQAPSVWVAAFGHAEFFGALFRAQWRAAGGVWSGTVRERSGVTQGEPWLVWESRADLAQAVRDIHKFSNNVMARQLFLSLSAHEPGGASLRGSSRLVMETLQQQGIDCDGLVIDNGSGLSRSARLSAQTVVSLLLAASRSRRADEFRESLPIAGVDGTMRHRLLDGPMVGRAWIKTGTLSDARAIAGYVDAVSGRRYAVALLVNGPRVTRGSLVQDRFLRWVHDHG